MIHLFASKEAKAIAASIREQPDEWTTADRFVARHKSGLMIWTGSEAWGLSYGFALCASELPCNVSDWSVIGGSPSQQAIWRAIKAHRRRGLGVTIERLRQAGIAPNPKEPDQ